MNIGKIIVCFFASTILITPIIAQNGTTGGTGEIYTWTINSGTTFRLQALGIIWGHNREITTQFCGATLIDTTSRYHQIIQDMHLDGTM